jgi:hypothetical protein
LVLLLRDGVETLGVVFCGNVVENGLILGLGQFWVGRFLDGESPKVVDDELDMFDWGAGFGEVLGYLNIAEAADIVVPVRD